MTAPTQHEAVSAVNAVRILNKWAPLVAPMERMAAPNHAAMLGDLKALCNRAALVTEESIYGELFAIYEDFLKFIAWYELLTTKSETPN